MRRFLTLVCLLCLAIPAGISISGCVRNPAANYCNGLGYGMKLGDVDVITIQPASTGISLAFGQMSQLSPPTATTCKGDKAIVSSYTYGTTNNQLLDISPSGNLCAGTWNRNVGGGIASYTVCTPPNPMPSTGGLPYATAYITASAQAVVSNPVEVFVHPLVTSVSLVTTPLSGAAQQCFSQNSQATLDAQACYGSAQYELCAPASVTSNFACRGGLPPGVTQVPDCTAAIGTLSYTVSTPSIASTLTNTITNQVTITAEQPGTTLITASVAGSGSSAGSFTTCPPASISVRLANGDTSGTITQGVTQNLNTSVFDTNTTLCPPTVENPSGGCPITGLAMTYQSTDPMDISAAVNGTITTSFPGVASVYAICQPYSCNPSPISDVGLYGTGLPLASNPVTITTPGTASDYVWFAAPGQSQYVVPVELITGSVGSTILLPYVPNSMVMDRLGTDLYFGSPHELMTYNIASHSIIGLNTNVPGVVLAVSPNNQLVLINDQIRQLFYLSTVSGSAFTTFGGMGNAAAWTPDSNTLYITDNAALNNVAEGITGHNDMLYVYNVNTGWTTTPLNPSPLTNSLPPGVLPPVTLPSPLPGNVAISSTMQTPAITIPSVGAYLRGDPTAAHTWCPSGTVGDYSSMIFYPEPAPDTENVQSDVLAATTNGLHILGAAFTGGNVTLNDIGVTVPASVCPGVGVEAPVAGGTLSPLSTGPWLNATPTLDPTKVNATAVNQIVASPESNLAFITYTADASNTGAQLPYYVPNSSAVSSGTSAPGTVGYIPLTGGSSIIAPLAGAFAPDDSLFYVSTAGDNKIHYISVPTLTDTQQISPNLPACSPVLDAGCLYSGPSNAFVPATAIAIVPRPVT